jgi:predicted small metal-binding protein
MKTINMSDLGCCDVELTAETTEQLVEATFAHAKADHPEKLAEMTPKMAAAMQPKILASIVEL